MGGVCNLCTSAYYFSRNTQTRLILLFLVFREHILSQARTSCDYFRNFLTRSKLNARNMAMKARREPWSNSPTAYVVVYVNVDLSHIGSHLLLHVET